MNYNSAFRCFRGRSGGGPGGGGGGIFRFLERFFMRETVVFLGMIKRGGGALTIGFVMDDNWLIIAIGSFFVFVTAEVFQLGKFHVLPTAEGKSLHHI